VGSSVILENGYVSLQKPSHLGWVACCILRNGPAVTVSPRWRKRCFWSQEPVVMTFLTHEVALNFFSGGWPVFPCHVCCLVSDVVWLTHVWTVKQWIETEKKRKSEILWWYVEEGKVIYLYSQCRRLRRRPMICWNIACDFGSGIKKPKLKRQKEELIQCHLSAKQRFWSSTKPTYSVAKCCSVMMVQVIRCSTLL